jgi:hypothetical protein
MAEDYTVQAGDCMSSIAYSHGFFWRTLWSLPQNAALKTKRKNPNVLMTGDIVHMPDLTVKQESGATEQTHQFMLKGVPEVLNMKLLDSNHQPRANVNYIITIEGKSRRGKTDPGGNIKESIPPDARTGKLVIDAPPDGSGIPSTQTMILKLGNLNPLSEVSGLKARLANLGLYKGPNDEKLDDATKQAISAFQKKKGLPVTGIADDATKTQINKTHGH